MVSERNGDEIFCNKRSVATGWLQNICFIIFSYLKEKCAIFPG